MAQLMQLRFLDVTNKDKPIFVTMYTHGKYKNHFKRELKEKVDSSTEGTSCRIQKGLFTEMKAVGNSWKQIDREKFKSLLKSANKDRTKVGWEPIELPEIDSGD